MKQLRKFCGQRQFIRANAQETVWLTQIVIQVHLKISMDKNRRSLVCSQSLDVFDTSLNGTSSRIK